MHPQSTLDLSKSHFKDYFQEKKNLKNNELLKMITEKFNSRKRKTESSLTKNEILNINENSSDLLELNNPNILLNKSPLPPPVCFPPLGPSNMNINNGYINHLSNNLIIPQPNNLNIPQSNLNNPPPNNLSINHAIYQNQKVINNHVLEIMNISCQNNNINQNQNFNNRFITNNAFPPQTQGSSIFSALHNHLNLNINETIKNPTYVNPGPNLKLNEIILNQNNLPFPHLNNYLEKPFLNLQQNNLKFNPINNISTDLTLGQNEQRFQENNNEFNKFNSNVDNFQKLENESKNNLINHEEPIPPQFLSIPLPKESPPKLPSKNNSPLNLGKKFENYEDILNENIEKKVSSKENLMEKQKRRKAFLDKLKREKNIEESDLLDDL